MPFSDFAKKGLVPFILGQPHLPYRSSSQLVQLFNDFGSRDVYKAGLPAHARTGQPMSRTQYVESRLTAIDDANLSLLLARVLSECENKDAATVSIGELIRPDGYTITRNDDAFTVVGGVINRNPPVNNQAHFLDIQNQILAVLDEAQISIVLVIAWFTNDVLRNRLLEKQQQGVNVTIAIFDDGINRRHGVDLVPFNVIRIRRAARGGLMHDKFCVVDNQIVITGSYNWTDNAEFRNDENITVERDPAQATRYSLEFRRLTAP